MNLNPEVYQAYRTIFGAALEYFHPDDISKLIDGNLTDNQFLQAIGKGVIKSILNIPEKDFQK